MAIRKGSKVSWKWGASTAEGKVEQVHRSRVTRTLKERKVTRNASDEEPAYDIVQEDGARVLKSASEVERD